MAEDKGQQKGQNEIQIVSAVLDGPSLVELIYDEEEKRTMFAIYTDGRIIYQNSIKGPGGASFSPVPASNNLIRHKVVVLPGKARPYESVSALTKEIEEYLERYVTLPVVFKKITARYVLLTWVYDRFNELPYLRFRGDFGSGKTRALHIVGSLLYKPMFASGASTVSPIFHTLDLFQGSLVFDEADFRFSDERAEITKILNNGNARGFPVLRSVQTDKKAFDPRAFHVYGPKLVSMREHFSDLALESRFLSLNMGGKPAPHVPINLPKAQEEEAKALRSKLLSYRFYEYENTHIDQSAYDGHLSSRSNQVLIPLLSITKEEEVRQEIRAYAALSEKGRLSVRQGELAAVVLEALLKVSATALSVPLSEVRRELLLSSSDEFDRPISSRYLGNLIRTKLNLNLYKSHGVFKVDLGNTEEVKRLCERFGVDTGAPSLES